MSILRSNAGWKAKDFKGMTFEKIEEKFIPVWEKMQDFVPMNFKLESKRLKRPGIQLDKKRFKKLKTAKVSEELYIEALQVKYPIIDWEIYSEGMRKCWKLIRVGNHTEVYQIFKDMLKKFDREDLDKLCSLVKETYSTTEVTDEKAKEIWVELKRLYKLDSRDPLWALQSPTVSISVPSVDVYTAKKFATVKDFALLHEEKIYTESKTTLWTIKGVLRKFEQWKFITQQCLQHEHYVLWEVIKFDDSYKAPSKETAKEKGLTGEVSSSTKKKGRTVAITAKDMQKRKNDVKARTTILLALPDEHQLRLSKYDSTKELLQAIVSHLEFMDVPIEQDDLNQKFLTSLALEWLVYTIVWRNKDDLNTVSMDDVYNHLKVCEPEVQ
nr:hypothetical protein [Tanacetum cinerariifolium]